MERNRLKGPIKRPSDLFEELLVAELRRVAALPHPWAILEKEEYPNFRVKWRTDTWLSHACTTGADAAGLLAFSAWLKDGPVIARVTPSQFEALAEVEVNLEVSEIHLPYPCVAVDLTQTDSLFRVVLVHQYAPDVLILQQLTESHQDDICTVIRHIPGTYAEESLRRFYGDLGAVLRQSTRAQRVAINMLLALTHFGSFSELLFPKEAERDARLSLEPTERGAKARMRLKEAPRLISFEREIILAKRVDSSGKDLPAGTGGEKGFHKRKGHWCLQPCGPGHSLRKRIFRAPVFVRIDKLVGAPADTTTIYRS
jgi:hypothetical protein